MSQTRSRAGKRDDQHLFQSRVERNHCVFGPIPVGKSTLVKLPFGSTPPSAADQLMSPRHELRSTPSAARLVLYPRPRSFFSAPFARPVFSSSPMPPPNNVRGATPTPPTQLLARPLRGWTQAGKTPARLRRRAVSVSRLPRSLRHPASFYL